MTRDEYITDPQPRYPRLLRRPGPALGALPPRRLEGRSRRGPLSPAPWCGPASITAASRSRWLAGGRIVVRLHGPLRIPQDAPSTFIRRSGSRTARSLHLVPHWNWAGSEGKPIKVMVTSNADKVELRLNGRSVGEQAVDKYQMATFDVPYEPGTLEAIASNGWKGSRALPSKRPARLQPCGWSPTGRVLRGRWCRRPAGHRRGGRRAGARRPHR